MQKMKIKDVLEALRSGNVVAVILPQGCENIEVETVGFFKPVDGEFDLAVELAYRGLVDNRVICLTEHYVGPISQKI